MVCARNAWIKRKRAIPKFFVPIPKPFAKSANAAAKKHAAKSLVIGLSPAIRRP